MRKTLKMLVVTLAAVSAVWAFVPNRSVSDRVIESEAESAQAGLYRANCARCHGADGHANTPAGRETDADDLTTGKVKGMAAARMAQIIKNGKGDMPAFKKLSAAQINGLVRYVKSL
jgi:mono/diheme cytochrome c family protein